MDQRISTRTQSVTAPSERPRGRMSPALLQRRLRDIHLYLGMLFAPSLLFFAITGALQLYRLHEVRPNQAFEPPALFQELGMVHKDQVFRMPRRRMPNPPATMPGSDASAPSATPVPVSEPRHSEWKAQILKAFFLLAAVALIASTCIGVWLGLRSGRNRSLALGLLLTGVLLPVLLLAL